MKTLTESEGRFVGRNRYGEPSVLYTKGGLLRLVRRIWWGKKRDGFHRNGDRKHCCPKYALGIDMRSTRFWDVATQGNIPFYTRYNVGDGFTVWLEGPKADYAGLIVVRRGEGNAS